MRFVALARPVALCALLATWAAHVPAASAQGSPAGSSPPGRFGPPWPDDDRPPVPLNVPREYDVMLTFTPNAAVPQTGSVTIDYPAMGPWPYGRIRCRSWCEGQVMVTLGTGRRSEMNYLAWSFLRNLPSGSGKADPRESITSEPPPDGYAQAWKRVYVHAPGMEMMSLPAETLVYLRPDAAGAPLEYVECVTRLNGPGTEPYCHVLTTLDGTPAVQVELWYSVVHWPERDAIRAAVMRLVRSWL